MRSRLSEIKNRYFDRAMMRWAAVGITTSGIDYLIFITLYSQVNSVFGANLVAGIVATTFNYLTHHRWTFKSDQKYSASGLRYLLNLSFWWIIGSSMIKGFITIGVDPKIAKLVPLIFIVPINFFVLNRIIFKRKR